MIHIKKNMTLIILFCYLGIYGISYHGTIIKLKFSGWTVSSQFLFDLPQLFAIIYTVVNVRR